MAKGFSFEEALQPATKGFSFEEALPTKPEPILSPEEQMMSSSIGQVAPPEANAPSVLAGTTLPDNAPAPTGRSLKEVAAGPDVSAIPKFDISKMPTAEERAAAQFGLTPEMGIGEKALRTGKASLYGAATGLEQTWLGGARMISDITGLGKEGVQGVSKQLSKEQQAVEKTFAPEYGLKIAKDIGSSVVQTLPIMGVGLAAGAPAALTSMFTQSFMQTYDDSRNEGLGVGASTARSALYGTAEALGESLGLGSLLKSAKSALKGVPTAELAKDLAKYIVKEIPGEQLTYVSQFLTDKGFGLNPEAGLTEFLQGAQDTALVTIGQTAVMGGAGFTTNKVLKELRSLHSKGEEGIPKAADMMKAAGFTFEQAQQPQGQVTVESAPPELENAQPITPPVEAAPTPIGAGEFEETPAVVIPEVTAPPVEVKAPETVTAVTPPAEKPTFDEWRTQQGLTFRSKEDYEAALPKLQAQYEAEIGGAPVAKTEAPEVVQEPVQVEELTIPVVNKDKEPTGETDVIKPETMYVDSVGHVFFEGNERNFSLDDIKRDLPDSPTKTAILEAADKSLDDFYKTVPGLKQPSKPSFYLPTRSSAKNIPSLGTDAVLDSTNSDVIKNVKSILKDYKVESGQSQEGNYLHAVDRDLMNNEENIEAPPITKNSVIPTASIQVSLYDGGFVASSSYNGKGQGYSSPISVFGKRYATRQEAIDAEANRIRKYAQEDKNTTAIKWLDSVSKPTKEGQVKINKARIVEKKAKTEKPAKKVEAAVPSEEKLVDAIQSMAYKNNTSTKSTANDFIAKFGRKMFDDAVKADLLDNEPGEGRLFPSNNYAYKVVSKYYDAKGKKIKAAKEEKPKAVPAKEVHIEGKKSEPVTSATIEDSIDKAVTKVDSKKIKSAIKNQFDQAIKRATILTEKEWKWTAATVDKNSYVTIDIPGDGKFKVKNNVERLKELQTKLSNATDLKARPSKREINAASVSSPETAFKNMVNEGDIENAMKYADLKALDIEALNLNDTQRNLIKQYKVKSMPQPSIEPGFTRTVKDRLQEIHDEKINEYSKLRRRVAHLTKKVAEGKVSLGIQRELNDLLELTKELKQDVRLTTPNNNTAEHFYKRALDEYTKRNINSDVLEVVKYFYDNNPAILNGIKLSVRQSDEDGVMGNFAPLQRIVTLYKGKGALSAGTARHEIMHSLEQMMNSDTRIAVIESWSGALKNAITMYGDDRQSARYFDAVLDFIDKPSENSFKRATDLMPSMDFYQYINPSEYWAVNAEKLMAAQMGTAWAKFVKFVKSLGERLKAMFGLENDLAIHKAFNDLIKNGNKRLDKESLTSYLNSSATGFDFLNDVKDVDDLLDKHNRSNTPLHPSGEVKDTIMGGYQKSKKISAKMAENPLLAVNNMTGKLDRAVTYARNKNIWYGSGLDQADFAKYNGELRNSQGMAVASVAVTNAIHAGHVATQVMFKGRLIFDPKTQMFRSEKSDKSLANVVRLKHDLEEKLGNQRAANVVNAYFEAKRSRSIVNEYLNRSADYEAAIEAGEDEAEAAKNLKSIEIAIQKVNMDDEAIDDFIALEKEYPELKKMMENWTAVNKNMLEMMEFAGVISKKRAEHLRNIKDYVPWYRIMDDQTDIHMPAGVRGMTNVGQEKKFKAGEVDRDIDDIVDNMIHNVMMMTRNSMKNYANNRIAMEYATRNEKGKIRLYPTEGSDANGIRVNLMANGRRVIVNIPDPLIAEASLGMENIEIPMIEILAFFANGLRRGITTFPVFQVSQLFMDAPTAAWVSGVKNPAAVWTKTFSGFIRALKPHDPIVDMLKSYGIGGYQSSARTPEKEMKLEFGLLDKSVWAKAMKTLDHIGDASDYAQRRAVYKQVLAETGDEMQALIQANNVIDFLKRGSGKGSQFVTRTVSFMNAYAQSIDVLATALAGGGLKGKSRKAAQAQMIKTGLLLAGTTLLYCMAVGADDDYDKLDDQTKIRNIIIPGTGIRLPMHTSASFFFKAIPELIYNKITKEGTKNQVDNTRLRKALGEAAIDSLLGPNMIPTGIKPVAEIALNHNFFTGGTLTPKGMEKLEAFRQYNSSTSEFGKVLSGLTMGALNPIEADHLVRGLFGTAGAAVMYGSNLFSSDRVAPQAKDNPLYGSFILPDVPRGREDLFYDLKERSDKKYETFVDLMKKQHPKEAKEYREENKGLIAAHGFVTGADADLKRINAEIRRLSDLPAEKMSSDEKRSRITRFQEQKNRILEKTIDFRLKAEL